ncbi:integrase, catalytic region, zinc finger, CCHC-type containing protein [Tanacetum coccineum]|uniref:Integrase, catalytic region, zinc finger, CCHC-type containing protein n=1 Tax=Tanacetum coccineum TaxID=301880 RepID=A0ABQ5IMU9_9ASTR
MPQQVITAAQLVPRYHTIGRCNNYVMLQSIPCSPECKIIRQILLDHPLSYALTATADVPVVYFQQFWRTVSKVPDTEDTIKFMLDTKEFTYIVDMFRVTLHLPVETRKNPFVAPVNIQTIKTFMNKVGYKGVVDKVNAFYTKNLAQPLQTMFKNKEAIQYPRFIKLIIADLMKKFPDIPQRVDEDYHSIKNDTSLISVYTTRNVLVRGMLIPDTFLTEEIRVVEGEKDDNDSEDMLEPGSHKENPEYIDDDDDEEKVDEEKDVDTGSLETRTGEMQTPIPTLPRSPRINLSSDKNITQELTDIVPLPTVTTSKTSHSKRRISNKYSHLLGALRKMCRRQGYMIQNMERKCVTTNYFWKTHKKVDRVLYEIVPQLAKKATNDLIENNLNPSIAATIIEDRDAFHSEVPDLVSQEFNAQAPKIIEELFKIYVQSNIIQEVLKRKFEESSTSNTSRRDDDIHSQRHDDHQEDDAPPEGEKRVKRHKASKSSKSAKGYSSKHSAKDSITITKVFKITTDQPHGLDFIEQIIMMRENDKPNSFSEADFKYLNKNDIEDLYYHCRNKKVNYHETKLMNSLIMFIRSRVIWKRVHDFQLGIKSYQIKVNLTAPTLIFLGIEAYEPYSIVDKPNTGLIYFNSKDEKRVMYLVKIVKFYDATLEKVLKEVKLKIFQSEPRKKPPLLGELDRDIMRSFEREIAKRLINKLQIRDGLHYNPYFPGGAIAMPKMLMDGAVEYEDGTPATEAQMGFNWIFVLSLVLLQVACYRCLRWSVLKSHKVIN